MKKEELLLKAIEKAAENGWFSGDRLLDLMNDRTRSYDIQAVAKAKVIFNHEFAKAFWGEENIEFETLAGKIGYVSWQYHLQKMVLEKDPLEYLEKFITPSPKKGKEV